MVGVVGEVGEVVVVVGGVVVVGWWLWGGRVGWRGELMSCRWAGIGVSQEVGGCNVLPCCMATSCGVMGL